MHSLKYLITAVCWNLVNEHYMYQLIHHTVQNTKEIDWKVATFKTNKPFQVQSIASMETLNCF